MDIDHFLRRIDAAQEHLEQLQQTADTTTVSQQITELRVEMSVALEELRVAQEELHQQNEQIYAANEKLQIERERYLELFEFAPGGYIVTDTHGTIREANRATAALLKVQPRYLVGKPLAVFIAREKTKEFRTNLASGLKSNVELEWETLLKPRGSTPVDVVITMSVARPITGQEKTIRWLLRNVTLRNQTETALQATQRFIQRAADALPDMLFIFDRVRQRYVYTSQGVSRILGYNPQEFVQMSPAMITNLRHPDDFSRISEFGQRFETAGDDQIIETTYRMKHNDGRWRWLTCREMVFARNPDGLPYQTVGIAQDVTERIEIDERMRQRNRELTALNLISAAVSSTLELPMLFSILKSLLAQQLDVQGGAIFLYSRNRQQLALHTSWGLPDDLLEKMKALPPELLARNQALAEEKIALAQGRCDAILTLTAKTTTLTPNYQSCLSLQFPSDDNAQGVMDLLSYDPFIFNEERLIYWKILCHQLGVAIQNARLFEEVRASHQSLKALSHRLVDVQENERRAVGRELHDEMGQSLTGLKLLLESQKRLPTYGAGAQLDNAIVLINELIGQVRSLSMRLRPAILDDLGLVPTLLWHFERYSAQSQIQVQFEHVGLEQRFASEIETAAYRITQEALTNAARYAGINKVSVRVWTTLHTLYVQISDQGKGFNLREVMTSGRANGLVGMNERVVLLNGRLDIDTAPGEGTCLTAALPLDRSGSGNVD